MDKYSELSENFVPKSETVGHQQPNDLSYPMNTMNRALIPEVSDLLENFNELLKMARQIDSQTGKDY